MIQHLVRLRGIGVQTATVLVQEAFVRRFPNGHALGAYAGLSPNALQQRRHGPRARDRQGR